MHDEKIKVRIEVKDIDLSYEIKKYSYWNHLSLNEDNDAFIYEYRHPIKNNENIPPLIQCPIHATAICTWRLECQEVKTALSNMQL